MFKSFCSKFRLPVVAIGLVCFVVASCGKRHEHMSATEPVPRNDPMWQDQFVKNSAAAKAGGKEYQLIFIGDSITELMKTAHPEMNAAFGPYHPQEFGISGDSTEHVLWRLQHGELDSLQPKVAVLLIGTNNLNDNSDEEIFEGIKLIVKDLRVRMPKTKIVVMALLPRGAMPDNIYRKRVAGVNELLGHGIADAEMVSYLDVGSVFLGPNGVMRMDLMPDQLHPSTAGYVAMYAAMKPEIDRLMAGGSPAL
jgi:lysophospholipase L1-like esterase